MADTTVIKVSSQASPRGELGQKYLASGIVDQMSMYGRTVSPLGSQRNLPVTSASGFSELEIIT